MPSFRIGTLGLLALVVACHKPLPEGVRSRLPVSPVAPAARPATIAPKKGRIVTVPLGPSHKAKSAPFAGSGNPQELPVEVERIWDEGRFTFMNVTVRNPSAYRLSKVALRCKVVGNGLVNMSFPEQSIVGPGQPPLAPGDQRRVEILLEKGVFDLRKVGCGARGW